MNPFLSSPEPRGYGPTGPAPGRILHFVSPVPRGPYTPLGKIAPPVMAACTNFLPDPFAGATLTSLVAINRAKKLASPPPWAKFSVHQGASPPKSPPTRPPEQRTTTPPVGVIAASSATAPPSHPPPHVEDKLGRSRLSPTLVHTSVKMPDAGHSVPAAASLSHLLLHLFTNLSAIAIILPNIKPGIF